MSYTTYLFDFDYTLADSSLGIVTCFRIVLHRHGYTSITDEEIKHTIGKTLEESFSLLTGITDANTLQSLKIEYEKEADTHMTVNTVLFLETKSVLLALKDAGAQIGIISTKGRYRIKELTDQHFSNGFFNIIVGGEDVKTAKPSPEGLLFAIKQLHSSKSETLYIGDSTIDAATAQAAGVSFAGVTHGMTTAKELSKYPHKKIMSSLEELLEDIEQHSNSDNEPSYNPTSHNDLSDNAVSDNDTPVSQPQPNPSSAISALRQSVTTRLRALHIKQIRGKQVPEARKESSTCLNCGTMYTGNFCNRCGQSCKTSRYRLSNALKNIMGGFTNIDNGFGRTLIDLLYRPGYMIRDFISGKRAPYFRPFQTLFVLAALYIMAVQLIDPAALKEKKATPAISQQQKTKIASNALQQRLTEEENPEVKEALSRSIETLAKAQKQLEQKAINDSVKVTVAIQNNDNSDVEQLLDNAINSFDNIKQNIQNAPFLYKVWNLLKSWGHGNKAFRIIATLPLFALATLMAFRRKKNKIRYNLTEHVFIQAYIACQVLLISIIALPINGKAMVDDLYELPILAIFALFCWDYKQLYGYPLGRSIRTTLLMFFYSLLLLLLFACLVVALIIAVVYLISLFC